MTDIDWNCIKCGKVLNPIGHICVDGPTTDGSFYVESLRFQLVNANTEIDHLRGYIKMFIRHSRELANDYTGFYQNLVTDAKDAIGYREDEDV